MIYGSLFSGLGGGDIGFDLAGWSCAWQVERDPSCRRILARHWPDVPKFDDVRDVTGAMLEQYGPVDAVIGGSPCQDLSVAGRRAGLAGERSGLFHEQLRIADECAAPWLLWENVPGALSSANGEDFATVLGLVTGFWPDVPDDGWRNAGWCVGPKRSAAWRVLDAQFVGGCRLHVDERGIGPVPQRRRRIFLVACAGAELRGAPVSVLIEPESMRGDLEAGGEAREGVASGIEGGARIRGDASGVTSPTITR